MIYIFYVVISVQSVSPINICFDHCNICFILLAMQRPVGLMPITTSTVSAWKAIPANIVICKYISLCHGFLKQINIHFDGSLQLCLLGIIYLVAS